jgi:hypothetical protein
MFGYDVANSATNFYWASDLLHRLLHIPSVGEGVVEHYGDASKYPGVLALAESNPSEAIRNSDTLQYFALEVYASDALAITARFPRRRLRRLPHLLARLPAPLLRRPRLLLLLRPLLLLARPLLLLRRQLAALLTRTIGTAPLACLSPLPLPPKCTQGWRVDEDDFHENKNYEGCMSVNYRPVFRLQ